jgi:hypothetical protein
MKMKAVYASETLEGTIYLQVHMTSPPRKPTSTFFRRENLKSHIPVKFPNENFICIYLKCHLSAFMCGVTRYIIIIIIIHCSYNDTSSIAHAL